MVFGYEQNTINSSERNIIGIASNPKTKLIKIKSTSSE